MSGFANALRSFHDGDLTQDQLLSEMYRQLAVERVAPVKLLEILNEHKLKQSLPDDTHETLLNRITSWPLEETVATRSSQRSSNAGSGGDPPATIVLGDQSGNTTGPVRGDGKSNRAPPATVGSVLQGRFSLIALIGEGGMSRVFKAVDLRRVEAGAHDPYVAVKVLTVPFSHYFGSMAALQREAHKLQSLTHQNIVRVIDCDRDGQSVFMTMEYLPGESLYKKLRHCGGTGLARDEAVTIITAIGNALDYAHRNHIVHGDLKPGNVIVDPKCNAKVIDFGMARFIARPTPGVKPAPAEEPTALTPRYASPEMLAGHAPEPADDVYALACLSYEVLTGRHPFGRVEESLGRQPQLRPPRATGLNGRQYRALARGLEYDRAKRTPTAAQFVKELRAAHRENRGRWLAAGVAAAMGVAAVMVGLALGPRDWLTRLTGSSVAPLAAKSMLRDCPTCPLMSVLPAGTFQQGADPNDPLATPFERPRHRVTIGYPLAFSINEITVGEFKEFADEAHRDMRGCEVYADDRWQQRPNASWRNPGHPQSPMHPASCVSWNDANAYAQWLSQKSGHAYRLPSASEWEYAQRAGSTDARTWGQRQDLACNHANVADQNALLVYPGWSTFECSDGFVATAPVGSFKPNAFGLNDMLGNVFEWTQDCWADDYRHAPTSGAAVAGSCRVHETRGGSWFTPPAYVRASYRNRFDADRRSAAVGFRVVREMNR